MNTKICKGCNRELSVERFTKSKNLKDGYENKCKECRRKARSQIHQHKCDWCAKEFTSAKKTTRFCSQECAGASKRRLVQKRCKNCGSIFETKRCSAETAKFCCFKCKSEWQSKSMRGENNPNYNRVEKHCDGCGKPILVIPSMVDKHNFCNHDCYIRNIGKYLSGALNPNYNMVDFTCKECKKTFKAQPRSRKHRNAFCSNECRLKWMAKTNKENTVAKKKINCEICGKSLFKTDNFISSRTHIYCSVECKNRGNSLFYSGENHPLYDSTKTQAERILGRKYTEYGRWRKAVYERDDYTCQVCGDSHGGNLVAHHLNSYSYFPNERTDAKNGITLCETCHKDFHGHYGYIRNTKTQFIEYLKHANTEPSLAEMLGRCND